MAIILEDEEGFKWGWYASSQPERLHLEVVAPLTCRNRYRVYLETLDGIRCFEPEDDIPPEVSERLKAEIGGDMRRFIEDLWVGHCIMGRKLEVFVDQSNGLAALVLYPQSSVTRFRTLNLCEFTDNPVHFSPRFHELDAETSCLVLADANGEGALHIILRDTLFEDS